MATNGWEKDDKNLVEGQREASKRSWKEVMLKQHKTEFLYILKSWPWKTAVFIFYLCYIYQL